MALTPAEEEQMRQLAARPDLYDILARSIAPSIYGSIGQFCVFQSFFSVLVVFLSSA